MGRVEDFGALGGIEVLEAYARLRRAAEWLEQLVGPLPRLFVERPREVAGLGTDDTDVLLAQHGAEPAVAGRLDERQVVHGALADVAQGLAQEFDLLGPSAVEEEQRGIRVAVLEEFERH